MNSMNVFIRSLLSRTQNIYSEKLYIYLVIIKKFSENQKTFLFIFNGLHSQVFCNKLYAKECSEYCLL